MSATLRPFSLPLEQPLETASDRIDRREGFLLRYTREGVRGVGEATPLPPWTESFRECELVMRRLREALAEGAEADAEAAAGDRPAASHALESALADRAARRADRPLYRYLGAGRRVETVPVNAVIGDGDASTTVERARCAEADGFSCVKIKVGAGDPTADLDRLRAVREAVGEDLELRVDANGEWDLETARELWPELAGLDIGLVEQPLSSEVLEGHRELRDLAGPRVAVDESVRAVGLEAVLDDEAADAVVLKPMSLGGPESAVSAAQQAIDRDVTPIVTTTVDGVVARTVAVHVAATLPNPVACGLATADRLSHDLATDPAPVSDGRIRVPQSPGHGVSPWGGGRA